MAREHHFPTPATRERPGEAQGSMGDLIRQLGEDGARLVRQEVALAKLELREMLAGVLRDAIGLVIAAGLAVLGGLALTATLILVLGRFVFGGDYWIGALVVGGVFTIAGGVWALAAGRGLGQNLRPAATVDSLREDLDWARGEARDFKRDVM